MNTDRLATKNPGGEKRVGGAGSDESEHGKCNRVLFVHILAEAVEMHQSGWLGVITGACTLVGRYKSEADCGFEKLMSEFTHLKIDAGIARLTLDRPEKRNALRREIIQALLDSVRRVAGDSSVRVLVLAANGEVFCAGMDLGQMQERAASSNATREYQLDSQVYCDLLTEIYELPVPTIAAVQGAVLAGGMGLVCACDIVIASEAAYFMLPEPMRGITASMVTPLLIHRIGPGPATWMLLSNEKVGAMGAHRIGLCHDVVAGRELDSRVDGLIRSILFGSRSAFTLTKKHIRDCLSADVVSLVRESIEVSATARETADAREGLAAFLEKRNPAWQTADPED